MTSETLILYTAQHTLDVELEALQQLRQRLDGSFVQCVQHIYDCRGRLVVTGIGKSALVGQKIAATLNSTGTPALFMHAADAIHGDLGMVQPNDFVLCISKSGETAEIKVLVPLLKNLGNTFIGMVANPSSYLAQQANYVLYTPINQEADPNNLAPTASTTAQMAMGDALATSLLALRGFTSRDFARYHPGGALGKRLYLRVSDLCTHNERPAVPCTASIRNVILEITSKRLGATAVLNDEGTLAGIITDGDLRRMLEKTTDTTHLTAANIMGAQPKTIPAQAMAAEALDLMRTHNISQLVVLDKTGAYEGMLHLHDLVREGII